MLRLALLLFAFLPVAHAHARQDPAPVKKAVEDYLRVQTGGLPGQVSFTVHGLASDNNLAPCVAFEVSQPPGARAWGRINLTVRCQEAGGWSVFVAAHVRVVANYLASARPLSQGQAVTEADLVLRTGDLSDLPAGVLTEMQQAVGRTVAMSIAAGRPLRADLLRQPMVIRQNQTVKVVSRGPGFEVANEGRALNNAAEGQVAQARLPNGQVISGIARASGFIEVTY